MYCTNEQILLTALPFVLITPTLFLSSLVITGTGTITGATGVSTTTLTASSTETFSNLTTDKGILYTNGSGVILKLHKLLLYGITCKCFRAPTWSKVDLAADVTGTYLLPMAVP